MSNFITKISSGNQSWEFHFSKITAADGNKYHVSVKDAFRLHHFYMNDGDGKWHIAHAPEPAQWIVALEKKLEKAILDYERAN
jgi:hypothetical protein